MAFVPGLFYTEKTDLKVDYIDATRKATSVDLPLITLPAGTLLFRAMKIPNPAMGEDVRQFYRDYLGTTEGAKLCLSPLQNVFFYPFPYVAFGAHTVGVTFTMIQISVLVHPVTVVCAMAPSDFVRGRALRYDGEAPWQRCSNFVGPGVECHARTSLERSALSYDNCLRPEFQASSGVRGWMAIADRDSLNPDVLEGTKKKATISKYVPMSAYLIRLFQVYPEEVNKLVASTYTDTKGRAGFPEIAVYPYKRHKGPGNIVRACPSNEMAMRLLEKEALADNLNFLPIAAFTKNGVVDMVNGHFNYEILKPTENAFVAEGSQQVINSKLHAYMELLQSEGIVLPYYGKCLVKYDSRTGFYVLDKIVGDFKPATPERFPLYKDILLPLHTPKEREVALQNMLTMRTYYPTKYLQMRRVSDKPPLQFMKYAFALKRFPYLKNLFAELGLEFPKMYSLYWGKSAKIHAEIMAEVGPTKPLTKAAAAAAPAAALAAAAAAPDAAAAPAAVAAPAAAAPPPLEFGQYYSKLPEEWMNKQNYAHFRTGESPEYAAKTPSTGGSRRIKKTKLRKTRSTSAKDLATVFTRLWKAHAKKKKV